MRHFVLILTSIVLLAISNFTVYGQTDLPRSEDYPISNGEYYKGKPASPLLGSKRARAYRTVLREGAKSGPNFAGRYTIVTWGAGLGVYSMAVVDAKTGRIYFPPFQTVGNTNYGLPYFDKGNNPAFRLDSKLFAVGGCPSNQDECSSDKYGLYLYAFDKGKFKLIRFVKWDTSAERESFEKEREQKLNYLDEIDEKTRRQINSGDQRLFCSQGRKLKVPISIDISCFNEQQAFIVNIVYHESNDMAAEEFKSHLRDANYPKWRMMSALDDEGIITDGCRRTWLRFRKGQFFIWINGNVNDASIHSEPNLSAKECLQKRDNVSDGLSQTAELIAKTIANILDTK
jgi:hypothetical protein